MMSICFMSGKKGRFLEGKRLCYVDTALSADGQTFLAGFSDMAGASYAVSLGTIDGRVTWTRPMEVPLTKLEMARNGERMAIATETGVISLIDAGMRTLYDFRAGRDGFGVGVFDGCIEGGVWHSRRRHRLD